MNGKGLEDELAALHVKYANKQLCTLLHVPTSVNIFFRRGSLVSGRLGEPCWCDYIGVLSGGTGVAGEAKTVKESARTRNRFPAQRITEHQRRSLRAMVRRGGVAFVFIQHFARGRKFNYLVPWTRRGLKGIRRGEKTPTWAALFKYMIPEYHTYLDAITYKDVWLWDQYSRSGWSGIGWALNALRG